MTDSLDDLMRLPLFIERYPNLCKPTTLRWWIQNRDDNGIENCGAVVQVGRAWFVNVPKMEAFILGRPAGQAA